VLVTASSGGPLRYLPKNYVLFALLLYYVKYILLLKFCNDVTMFKTICIVYFTFCSNIAKSIEFKQVTQCSPWWWCNKQRKV